MKIKFNGAARTVTGSQLLLEVNNQRLLLEFGLYQGKRAETNLENRNLPYDTKSIDAVVLTHAHIDHCGNLPNLIKHGYSGPIYTTPPTAKLSDIMLQDSGHIQEADTVYVNKKRFRHGEAPVEPLYTVEDAKLVTDYFEPVNYHQYFEPIKGVTAHLVDAGHVLGAASVVLDVEENGKTNRIWFSGDIGRHGLPLVNDPTLPKDVDYLIMECTYGDKQRPGHAVAYTELRDVVLKTIERKGKVIIPSFALGRTQELVYDLYQMISSGEIPPVPVYVDSPLAINATRIFQDFADYLDIDEREFLRKGKHPALYFDGLFYVRSVEESMSLNERKEPMIIISASGMAENGRIRHHLKNNIEDARNTILIVSWQSPETLGRRLADKERVVKIFGENYYRRAEVATINGFSAHADQNMLLEYAVSSKNSLKKLFLVHGEARSANPFMTLLEQNGIKNFVYPRKGDVFDSTLE
jgi:metallo-beta-lactamase family protein